MTRSALFVLALIACVVVACGDDDDAGGGTTSNTEPTQGTPRTTSVVTASTTAPITTAPITTAPITTAPITTAPITTAPITSAEARSQVGTVLGIVSPGGTVDGQTAEQDMAILTRGVLETVPAGKIHFSVNDTFDECILRAQALAVIEPGDGRALRLDRGEATCSKPGEAPVLISVGGETIELLASGAEAPTVFELAVDDQGRFQVIRVGLGEVRLRGTTVATGQQATVNSGGQLTQAPIPIVGRDLSDIVGRTTASLDGDPPVLDVDDPTPTGSTTSSSTIPPTTSSSPTTVPPTTSTTSPPGGPLCQVPVPGCQTAANSENQVVRGD